MNINKTFLSIVFLVSLSFNSWAQKEEKPSEYAWMQNFRKTNLYFIDYSYPDYYKNRLIKKGKANEVEKHEKGIAEEMQKIKDGFNASRLFWKVASINFVSYDSAVTIRKKRPHDIQCTLFDYPLSYIKFIKVGGSYDIGTIYLQGFYPESVSDFKRIFNMYVYFFNEHKEMDIANNHYAKAKRKWEDDRLLEFTEKLSTKTLLIPLFADKKENQLLEEALKHWEWGNVKMEYIDEINRKRENNIPGYYYLLESRYRDGQFSGLNYFYFLSTENDELQYAFSSNGHGFNAPAIDMLKDRIQNRKKELEKEK